MTIAQIIADNKAKRQAVLAGVDLEITKKAPKCRCGTEMTQHLTQGYYWCRFCQIRDVDLVGTNHESRESKAVKELQILYPYEEVKDV